MPQYRNQFDPGTGAHIDVIVSKPIDIYGEEYAARSETRLHMLIDTGASKTAIGTKAIQAMNLQPVEKRTVRFATAERSVNLYQIDMTCDIFSPPFYLANISVMGFDFVDGWKGGILGRDFLEKIAIEINGPEKYFKITV